MSEKFNKTKNNGAFIIKKYFNLLTKSDTTTSSMQKIRISFFSILGGILVSSLILIFIGKNPFNVFLHLLQGSFKSKAQIYNLLRLTGCFVVASLAIAFAFKAGLFNIGVSGQMMISGAIVMVIGLKYHLHWVILIILAILIGAITSGISGLLKAFFNVHEVVSTLLLNWVWFYLYQFITKAGRSYMDGNGNSEALTGPSLISSNLTRVIVIGLLAIVSIVIVFIIFSKTTFGFKLKSVGLNPNASKYAGINVKLKIIQSMAISGMLAGLLGGLVYLLKNQQIKNLQSISLPSEGFDGIAISLLAFNNPIGIIIISFFWSILNIGGQYMAIVDNVSAQVVQMIIGIIIYFSAISTIFIKLKPIYITRNIYYDLKDKALWKIKLSFKKDKELLKENFKRRKEEISNLNIDKNLFKEKKIDLRKNIHEINIKFKKKSYENKVNNELERNKEINLLRKKFEDWARESNFLLMNDAKNDYKTQLSILKVNFKTSFKKHKVERNKKNKIGIYNSYKENIMEYISQFDIKVIDLKKDLLLKKKDIMNSKDFKEKYKILMKNYKKNYKKMNINFEDKLKNLKIEYKKKIRESRKV